MMKRRAERRVIAYQIRAGIFVGIFALTLAIRAFTNVFSWIDIGLFYLLYPSPSLGLENQDIVLVEIDGQNSPGQKGGTDFSEIGLSIGLRALYPKLIKNMVDDGCKLICFDMEFTRPSAYDEAFSEGLRYAREHMVPVIAGYKISTGEGRESYLPGANEKLLGYFSAFGVNSVESDRLFRIAHRIRPFTESNGILYLSSALQALRYYQGGSPIQFYPDRIKIGVKNLKMGLQSRFLIDYRNNIPMIGIADAYHNRFEAGTFSERVAIIGAAYQGIDMKNTPLGRRYGVEIQAQVLANLMLDNYIRVLDIEVIIIMSCVLLAFLLLARKFKGIFWALLLSSLIIAAAVAAAAAMRTCVMVNISPLLFFLFNVSLALVLFQKAVFTRRVYRSIMFCDIEGSVRLFDMNGDRKAVGCVHEFYGIVKPILRRWRCEFYRKLGDAVLVSFPSALNAANAGWAVQEAVAKRNRGLHAPENPELRVRVSINSGWCSVLDAQDLLGQTVNIAARIEGMTEADEILVSKETREEIEKTGGSKYFDFDDVREVDLRGLSKKTTVCRIRSR